MSYRTCIDNTQIFGNNEYYPEWSEFLKSRGIIEDEDGCYEGEIDDVQGLFEVVDKITKRLIKEQHERVKKGETNYKGKPLRELADLSGSMWLNNKTPVLMFNKQMIENAYCFMPYQVFHAIEDKIERVNGVYEKDGVEWTFLTYKLKEGEKIKVSAS